MNLLQLLLNTLTTNQSVDTVSKKTGISSKMTSTLLMAAIPLLISYMTKNASSKKGAQSLANALTQHTSTSTAKQQIETADEDDGSKIIAHILGNDQTKVVNNLADETGLTASQVTKTLSTIAPYLLSSLSTATTTATKQQQQKQTATKTTKSSGVDLSDGIDLSDLMGLLGGATSTSSQSSGSGLTGMLLDSLLGTSTQTTKKTTKKTAQQSSGLDLNTLMGLLGGTSNTQQSQSAFDGSDLLNILTALSK